MKLIEFQLLIKPTSYDCNLDCAYCFYKRVEQVYPDDVRPRMSTEVLEVLIQKFLKYRFSTSVFCWQGGEPTLMGLNFFKKVIQLQQKHGSRGQVVSNVLQTNGILIDEAWASFLREYKFFVGVSIDGPEVIHNQFRKSTWEKVMNCVKILREFKVEFNILCVISSANVNRGQELYQFFRENDLKYLQFIPALECTKDRKMASYSPTSKEYGKFLCEMFDLWKKDGFGNVHIRMFEDILTAYMGQSERLCLFGENCSDYFVIEWNGDVYPCDFYVKPELRLGNVANYEDFSDFIKTRVEKFSYRKAELGPTCVKCHWKNICHGGCIKDRDFCQNRDKNRSYYCNAYKEFFTHSHKWFYRTRAKIQQEKGMTLTPTVKKIRRNDNCPCGSGVKYKKCHGKN